MDSAPQNSLANFKLYVDGVQQSSGATLDNNGRVVLSITTPLLLRSGQRTLEVRADNLAGSGRTFQFTIESAGDALFTDSAYNAYIALTSSVSGCSTYWTLNCAQAPVTTIGQGVLTLQSDPAFTSTRAIGGASQVTIAKYVARAYGEDAKVYTLTVNPSITSGVTNPAGGLGLKNVALYLNGGQIGTQQDLTSNNGFVTFNLGSQFIVPAGTSVSLEVKSWYIFCKFCK